MNRFPLPLNVSLNDGERDEWTLLSPFQYIDPDLGLITVPEGYTTNFSIFTSIHRGIYDNIRQSI